MIGRYSGIHHGQNWLEVVTDNDEEWSNTWVIYTDTFEDAWCC